METLIRDWKLEYEQEESQQINIERDKDQDKGKSSRTKETHRKRHSRFGLHLRRTYGNQAVCRCILQCGRFDDKLLDCILDTVQEHVAQEDRDEEELTQKKWAKVRATNAFRRGKHLVKLVEQNWNARFEVPPSRHS